MSCRSVIKKNAQILDSVVFGFHFHHLLSVY